MPSPSDLNYGALTRAQEDAYVAALHASHRIRLEVDILNSSEKPVGSFSAPSNMVVDGSVQVEAAEDVTRSLSLTLLDPGHKVPFTPANPSRAGIYAENFLRVHYCVLVPDALAAAQSIDAGFWVSVPVFWGPLSLFEHTDETLTIEAQGKERLGLAPHYVREGYTLRKGERIDEAIKRVMRKTGERRFDIPRLPGKKLDADRVVRPNEEPWRVIMGSEDEGGKKSQALIDQTGKKPHRIYYDGAGRLVVRRQRKQTTFTFKKHGLLTEPTLSYDMTETINHVRVKGGKAKGSQREVTGEASLPDAHPMSPKSLVRNGEKRYMTAFVDAPNLKTKADCNEKADDVLSDRARVALEASFEALPVPHLEPWDRVAVDTAEGRVEFVLRSFTLPLTASEGMSVGHTKRVKQRKRRRGGGHVTGTISRDGDLVIR